MLSSRALRPRLVATLGALSFQLGRTGFSALMNATTAAYRGLAESMLEEIGQEVFVKHLATQIYPESRAIVEAHQEAGHTVAIITSATRYQAEPLARDMGIDHVMCTYLEVEDGKFTGGVVRPTCFGEGKVTAAEELADKYKADLDNSFFYSDSYDDIQLLERVGHPKVLNPSSKLERKALHNGWPVARFGSRGRPTATQFIRSVAATASLVTRSTRVRLPSAWMIFPICGWMLKFQK